MAAASLLLVTAPASANSRRTGRKHRARAARVRTGLDVLEAEKFAPLRGRHVGLITNHTGVDAQGRTTIDVLRHAPGVQLVALFSPEHGIAGRVDEKYASSKDPASGLPIYSLYGDTYHPTDEMLKGIDALVYDVQDAGVRFYTYTTTMGYCLESAAQHHITFYVLDRPNLLGGEVIEGPVLDKDKTNFVAYFPEPVRYGLTLGELAEMFTVENHIGADLHVIQMKGWRRNYYFEDTGLRWIPPSPNLRTIKGSVLYPGLEILQAAGVSVGRGTQAPFEEFGAPWMDGGTVAAALNARHIAGVRFTEQPFIPVAGLYAGQRCGGVGIRITERDAVRSMTMGIEIATVLHKLYPGQFQVRKMIELVGNAKTVQQLEDGVSPEQIVNGWSADLAAFDEMRRKYFIYK